MRVKRSSGTALAFRKKNILITAFAYALLLSLGYLIWLDQQGITFESLVSELNV